LFAQGGERAGKVCVFNAVVFFEFVGDGGGVTDFEGSGNGGMRDGILARDDVTVGKTDRDVMREVGVDGRENGSVAGDGADAGEEVDG
jgi:hypothetical protein